MELSSERQNAISSLIEFPYLGNYLRLSLIEWDLLELQGSESVLFIGSGPFPLTAISLNLISRASDNDRLHHLRELCSAERLDSAAASRELEILLHARSNEKSSLSFMLLDRSSEATQFANQMVETLGLSGNMRALCQEGDSVTIDQRCSVIYIASMVQDKVTVIQNIIQQATRPIRFLIRGVEPGTLKELLYEPLSETAIESIQSTFPTFKEIKTFWPDNRSGVINSVHIFSYSPAS